MLFLKKLLALIALFLGASAFASVPMLPGCPPHPDPDFPAPGCTAQDVSCAPETRPPGHPGNGTGMCLYGIAQTGAGVSGGYYFYPVASLPDGGVCPANSTPNGSGACDCASGSQEQGGQCVNPDQACQAKSGTSEIVNLTVAWQRTPSTAFGEEWLHYTNVLRKDGTGSVCNGGCMQNFDSNEACPDCKAYVSQTASPQGLYRFSIDMLGHYTGGSCTEGPTDQAAKADDSKDPSCPGFVGEVNGVKGCYGTADKPVRTEPPDPNADRKPRESGNPSAGTKPESGPGSGSGGAGRTPSTGSGGSQGGPASAAGSGSGDGTTDKPEDGKEQQNCGAPGQPPCKLDESGTPGTFSPNSGVKDYKDKMDQQREQIKGAGDGVFGGLNVFFSAPPVVGCSPFDLPNEMGSIDPCAVVDGVRAVMAYLWAIAALWLCLGWIREAV